MSPIEKFAQAVTDLHAACDALGIKPPSTITFKTARHANLVAQELVRLRDETGAVAVTVDAHDRALYLGTLIKVAFD